MHKTNKHIEIHLIFLTIKGIHIKIRKYFFIYKVGKDDSNTVVLNLIQMQFDSALWKIT